MNRNKFSIAAALIVSMAAVAASCSKDDKPEEVTPKDVVVIQPANGSITSNRTFSADSIYLLKGFVHVEDGVTLTIQPGTIIKGDKDSKATLIVKRGGKIMAQGTKEKPIVFTSNQPAGTRKYGDWGGIIICGKATVNSDTGEARVEGGPDAYYGGGTSPIDTDNSGVMTYVRIEFCGVEYQVDNEINGLTLCGVGSGTKIENIQVSYCGDDSFEWFGGTVNAKYLVSYRSWDDDFDTDFGYSGKLQFLVALRDPDVADKSDSNGFESDNANPGTENMPYTRPVFSNVSIFGPYANGVAPDPTGGNGQFGRAMHLRRNTKLKVYNSVFAGWPVGLHIDGTLTQDNANNSELVVKNCVLAGMVNAGKAQFDNDYIADPANNITKYTNNSELLLNAPFRLGSPDFKPAAGSPLLGQDVSALFADDVLKDAFFQQVNYKGAFGTQDWTEGWCNWDPQNTDYK